MLQTIPPTLTHVFSPFSLFFFEFGVIYKDSSLTYATPVLASINTYNQRKFHDQYFI